MTKYVFDFYDIVTGNAIYNIPLNFLPPINMFITIKEYKDINGHRIDVYNKKSEIIDRIILMGTVTSYTTNITDVGSVNSVPYWTSKIAINIDSSLIQF